MRSAAAATSGSEPPYRWVLAWFSRTATNAPAAWRRRAVRLSWGRCVEHAFGQIHQSGVQGLDVSSHLGAGSRVVEQDSVQRAGLEAGELEPGRQPLQRPGHRHRPTLHSERDDADDPGGPGHRPGAVEADA
jgi:hypothetical protein